MAVAWVRLCASCSGVPPVSSLAPPSFDASLVSVCHPLPVSVLVLSRLQSSTRPSPLDVSAVRGHTFREGGDVSGLFVVFFLLPMCSVT